MGHVPNHLVRIRSHARICYNDFMLEKPPIYDDEGRIADPKIAREAADIENKFHKKEFGMFRPSKSEIKKGANKAELAIEKGKPVKEKGFFGSFERKVEMKKLPHVIQEWAERLKQKGGYEFWRGLEADIGGGVTRYRLYGFKKQNAKRNEIQLVLDLKDGAVIHSETRDEGEFDEGVIYTPQV